MVARSSAEAEYRADAKAPGRDFPLKSHTLGEGISFHSFARDEKLSVLFDSQERILPSNLKKAYSLRVTADSTGCLFERRKPFERKMNVNVPVRLQVNFSL